MACSRQRRIEPGLRSVPAILDHGREACTGFALAGVINFLLAARNLEERRVSPRMLSDMARRYDEWPGENCSGSSARGAMKGWVAHGVCTAEKWTMQMTGPGQLTPALAEEAQPTPGGAYFCVMHRQVRDMHAALHEVGILYVTLMVHAGRLSREAAATPSVKKTESKPPCDGSGTVKPQAITDDGREAMKGYKPMEAVPLEDRDVVDPVVRPGMLIVQ